jgi:hypothetical protein
MSGEIYASDPKKDILTVRWRTSTGFDTRVCTSEAFARDWELTGKATNRSRGLLLIVTKVLFAVGVLVVALWVVDDIRHGAGTSVKSVNSEASTANSVQQEAVKQVVVPWDGDPNHYDCSSKGHPDPKHPGETISDADEDEPCVSNSPIPPRVDPLAGASPDTEHCFGRGWGTLPDNTEGDRKCNPLRRAALAKFDRQNRIYQASGTAKMVRWINVPGQPPESADQFDEVYELPGEDKDSPCAEVSVSSDGYKVTIYAHNGAGRSLEEPTRHLAEVAAVSICGSN